MLRLISYLAPSIPADYFELVRRVIAQAVHDEVRLQFEYRISGPLEGDENPFADNTADIGFVCAPAHVAFGGELRSFGFARFVDATRSDYEDAVSRP